MNIALDSPIGIALIKAGGVLESGMIANMRTYMLPVEPRAHVRVLGLDRTLCGRSLRNNEQWAWQFINRGRFNERLPSHSWHGRDVCKICSKHPFIVQTAKVQEAKKVTWGAKRRRRKHY